MKTVSKLALAVTLMIGNIEYNAPQTDFYEDDSDFLQVSSVLETGWGWSLNKAIAQENCSAMEGSEARQCEEEQEEEVIEVIGSFDEQSSYGGGGGDQSSYGEPDGGGGGGGGVDGGGATEEEVTADELAREKKILEERLCVLEASVLLNKCLADGADELTLGLIACGVATGAAGVLVPWAGVGVAVGCGVAYLYDKGVIDEGCEAEFISATDSCH